MSVFDTIIQRCEEEIVPLAYPKDKKWLSQAVARVEARNNKLMRIIETIRDIQTMDQNDDR